MLAKRPDLALPRRIRFPSRVVVVSIALAVSACTANTRPRSPAMANRPVPRVGTTAEGTASWYGPGYDGKRTACGDRFDQDDLTAAHGTWPCGTKVKVTLLSNGKSVTVHVTDLFPNHKGRLIDLSKGAAKKIGLIGPGTGRVRVEVVS